jgi:deazaflavin-dependent oxidoreductase (nitroreductase family)
MPAIGPLILSIPLLTDWIAQAARAASCRVGCHPLRLSHGEAECSHRTPAAARLESVKAQANNAVPVHHRWIRWFAATTLGAWLFARILHRLDRIAFRLSGGRRTVTSAVSGLPVIMLTTTGSRTGLPRMVPVLGFPIQRDIAIAAGNFGRTRDPAWCLNLRRDPHAQIIVDGRIRQVVAEELAGEARQTVWRQCLAVYPGGAAYAARAGARTIGVFLLHTDDA